MGKKEDKKARRRENMKRVAKTLAALERERERERAAL